MTTNDTTAEVVGPDLKPIPQTDKRGLALLVEMLERIEADQSAWNQEAWISVPGGLEMARNEANSFKLEYKNTFSAEVLAYIEEHQVPPWDCGTAYCLAGHAVLACGAKLATDQIEFARKYRVLNVHTVIPAGEKGRVSVEAHARELLGLTKTSCAALFHQDNTLPDLRLLVDALVENPDADLYHVTPYVRAIDWVGTPHASDPYPEDEYEEDDDYDGDEG